MRTGFKCESGRDQRDLDRLAFELITSFRELWHNFFEQESHKS